jgi:hypothetical protein
MIKIKDTVKNMEFMYIGCVNSENDFVKISYMFEHNRKIINQFAKRHIILNCESGYEKDLDKVSKLAIASGYDTYEIKNFGYQFGFLHGCTEANIIPTLPYFQCNIDTLLFDEMMDITIDETADINFLPSVTSLYKCLYNEEEYNKYKQDTFVQEVGEKWLGASSQGWVYITKPNIPNFLGDWKPKYEKWIEDGSGDKYSQNVCICSEQSLIDSYINKKRYCIMQDKDFDSYIDIIKRFKIMDASAKNVCLEFYGIFHWHWKDRGIYKHK